MLVVQLKNERMNTSLEFVSSGREDFIENVSERFAFNRFDH